jgi:hypothetical protein
MYLMFIGLVHVCVALVYTRSVELPTISGTKPASIFPSSPVTTTTFPLVGAADVAMAVLSASLDVAISPERVDDAASAPVASSTIPDVVADAMLVLAVIGKVVNVHCPVIVSSFPFAVYSLYSCGAFEKITDVPPECAKRSDVDAVYGVSGERPRVHPEIVTLPPVLVPIVVHDTNSWRERDPGSNVM